jgi:gluconolactonase
MIYEHFLPEGQNLFHPDYPFTQIATDFRFLEGPAWHPYEHHLTFSDIMGNALYRWFPQSGIQVLRPNSYLSNGNTYDRKGLLITCEHGTSAVSRTETDGTRTVLAARFKDRALNSPNDVVVRKNGSILFTDPIPGRVGRVGIPREPELDFKGLFSLNPNNSELTLLADDFSLPNGLCVSLDETELFVNDSTHQHIRRFTFNHDGSVSGGEVWAELVTDGPGVADGMKFSREGLLFCSAPRGIQVFNAEGELAGRLYTPEIAANFTWGGPDMRTLYLTARTSLYSIRTAAEGIPLF